MGHGGKREGAGRPEKPKPQYSDALKRDVAKGLKAVAKELGRSYGEILAATAAGMKYDETGKLIPDNIQDTVRISAQKLIAEIMVVKETKSEVKTEEIRRPTVYLPETMAEPEGETDE